MLGNYNISTLCVYICFQPAGIYWGLYSSIIHVLISLILFQINFENHLFLHYKTSIYHQVSFPGLSPTSSQCTMVTTPAFPPPARSVPCMVSFPPLAHGVPWSCSPAFSPTSTQCTVLMLQATSIACAGLEIKHQQRRWQFGRVWEQVCINSV